MVVVRRVVTITRSKVIVSMSSRLEAPVLETSLFARCQTQVNTQRESAKGHWF